MATKKEKEIVETQKFSPNHGEVMTYNSYFYLYRKTKDNKNIVLRNSPIQGWFGFEVAETEITPTDPAKWQNGNSEMPPFNSFQLEEFRNMTDEQLINATKK